MERAGCDHDDRDKKSAVVMNPPEGGHHHLTKAWWCPALAGLLLAALASCNDKPSEPQPIVVVTRQVGSWSGRGTTTVGDVNSDTGRLRIIWQTGNEQPSGSGYFKLTLRSGVSGRTIAVVADHRGVGTGTVDTDEGPRTYDFLVESANVDWQFRVEETSGAYEKRRSP
jgi:hypothetical protein